MVEVKARMVWDNFFVVSFVGNNQNSPQPPLAPATSSRRQAPNASQEYSSMYIQSSMLHLNHRR